MNILPAFISSLISTIVGILFWYFIISESKKYNDKYILAFLIFPGGVYLIFPIVLIWTSIELIFK